MENFEFKSQICTTKEQSEKLLALGLKKETADMHITNMSSKGINYIDDWQVGSIPYCNAMSFFDSRGLQLGKTAWSIIPAWSLDCLIHMAKGKRGVVIIRVGESNYAALIKRIEYLIKQGIFNKDYLEDEIK